MHCPVTTAELIEKEREAVKLKREAEKQVSNTVIYIIHLSEADCQIRLFENRL